MARVSRQGVDYFPLDVDLDSKFKFLEAKHGLVGFAVIIKMLQSIYREGYWISFGEDEQMIYASEFKLGLETFMSIIETSLEKDIFSSEIFKKYNVLTSRGIQKQYREMTKRRKEVEIVCEYTLVTELMSASCKHHVSKSTQTETETETETENENENERPEVGIVVNPERNIFSEYEKAGFGLASSMQAEMLMDLEKTYGFEMVADALRESARQSVFKIGYVEGILKNWKANGRRNNVEPGGQNKAAAEEPRRKYGRVWTEEELNAIDPNL